MKFAVDPREDSESLSAAVGDANAEARGECVPVLGLALSGLLYASRKASVSLWRGIQCYQ